MIGRGEDAVLVGVRPLFEHPAVQGVDGGGAELGIVTHALLDQAGQGGQHDGVVDALLVEQLEAVGGVAEGGRAVDAAADDLPVGLAVGVADPEVLLLGARPADPLEGRVGDVVADLAPDHDFGPAVDVDVVDGALVLRREELGQRIGSLVQVVVGVEDRKAK